MLTPEEVRPFPKAQPRKNQIFRKRGRTRILTDTPEKQEIETMQAKRKKYGKHTLQVKQGKRKLFKKFSIPEESSASDTSSVELSKSDESDIPPEEDDLDFSTSDLAIGDFILVKFKGKKMVIHYAARISAINGEEYEVSYLRRKGSSSKFVFPLEEDSSCITKDDVVLKLPPPQCHGGTQRTSSIFYFSINFDSYYNLR